MRHLAQENSSTETELCLIEGFPQGFLFHISRLNMTASLRHFQPICGSLAIMATTFLPSETGSKFDTTEGTKTFASIGSLVCQAGGAKQEMSPKRAHKISEGTGSARLCAYVKIWTLNSVMDQALHNRRVVRGQGQCNKHCLGDPEL